MPEVVLILIRSVLSFVILLTMCRLMGKQELSQLTFFDYVVGITIGSIAAEMAINQNTMILNGVIGLIVWGGFPILLGFIGMKSYRFRHLTDGRPTVLIKDGQIQEKNLKKNKLTMEQLMTQLRAKNAYKLSEVEFALLETNGQLSVLKKTDSEPITPKILGMMVEQEKEPRIVIMDGNVMEKTLKSLDYTRNWLLSEIRKQGANDFGDVFLAQLDSKGNVYVDLYSDSVQKNTIQQRPLTAATLKKIHSNLQIFSLETQNQTAKQNYQKQAQNLQQIIDELEPYLKE